MAVAPPRRPGADREAGLFKTGTLLLVFSFAASQSDGPHEPRRVDRPLGNSWRGFDACRQQGFSYQSTGH